MCMFTSRSAGKCGGLEENGFALQYPLLKHLERDCARVRLQMCSVAQASHICILGYLQALKGCSRFLTYRYVYVKGGSKVRGVFESGERRVERGVEEERKFHSATTEQTMS